MDQFKYTHILHILGTHENGVGWHDTYRVNPASMKWAEQVIAKHQEQGHEAKLLPIGEAV